MVSCPTEIVNSLHSLPRRNHSQLKCHSWKTWIILKNNFLQCTEKTERIKKEKVTNQVQTFLLFYSFCPFTGVHYFLYLATSWTKAVIAWAGIPKSQSFQRDKKVLASMLTPQVLYKFCTLSCSGVKILFTKKSQDFERLGLSIEKHFNLKFSQIVEFSKIRENIQRQSCCFVIWDSTRCFPGKCHHREFCTQ